MTDDFTLRLALKETALLCRHRAKIIRAAVKDLELQAKLLDDEADRISAMLQG